MLNFGYNLNTSRSERRFVRHFVGDVTFAREQVRTRQKLFLQRNLEQVLNYHQNRREARKGSTSVLRDFDGAVRGAAASAAGAVAAGLSSADGSATSGVPFASWPVPRSTRPDMESNPRSSMSRPEKSERSTRRSIRGLLEKVYERPEAELVLDLDSIRKKLNFKTNYPDDNERPAKRQKRDTVKCQCHLTIWDNRGGHEAVLITKSTYCRVTATETESRGYFVDTELDKPFVIKADDLKVSVPTKDGSILGFTDKYFLEIKIIPCRNGSRWPPIPLLGKSDGDHFARDARKTGIEDLQGAVVARYTHLPQAPDPDVPLSVFFLHEGRTYRTKYGLQVLSAWQKSTSPVKSMKARSTGLDIDSFRPPKPSVAELPPSTKKDPVATAVVETAQQPEVCYNFSPALSTQMAQDFRIATVKGYRCPLCTIWKTSKLQNLQFHLSTMHSKYHFSVQKPRRDPTTNDLTHIQVRVDLATTIKKQEEDTKAFEWQVPDNPFDLTAYVEGDHSWVGEETYKKSSLAEPPGPVSASIKKPTSGSLPAEAVPDFRQPQRKKYRAIRLESKYEVEEPVYTSVSHRPVSPSEEPRSETDDEIDNDWQIELHMERLDLAAKREGWSDYECELRKRWDTHRMEEHLEHPQYLSNSLIRFVRKHRNWLKSADDDLLMVFFEFLESLKDRGVVDDNNVSDVNELIFQDEDVSEDTPTTKPKPKPSTLKTSPSGTEAFSMTTRGRHRRETDPQTSRNLNSTIPLEPSSLHDGIGTPTSTPKETKQTQTQTQTQTPATKHTGFNCGHCAKPINRVMHNAILCADPACETPRVMYHRRCARLQLGYDASRTHTLEQTTKDKVLVPSAANANTAKPGGRTSIGTTTANGAGKQKNHLDLPVINWSCPTCVQRQKAKAKVPPALISTVTPTLTTIIPTNVKTPSGLRTFTT
ncbi:hypothetical protein A1O1_02039 [Capronia coronata CBS 617.96]|uniref:Polycomb protein VEFS-Box domain-containing protein n=1 Tax=Capronia coronata CBS 617.96 TaxID=1182541 RepID=W9YL60_9EURO|nr:uncharacterized protein A1O1_02039 [Capronia coronata CBS 617.96]EXJ93647.1 hypothetical protein A1O1_02039 [Capronia coronata CBS 617.96]